MMNDDGLHSSASVSVRQESRRAVTRRLARGWSVERQSRAGEEGRKERTCHSFPDLT